MTIKQILAEKFERGYLYANSKMGSVQGTGTGKG